MRHPVPLVYFFQARAKGPVQGGANRSGLAVTPLRSGCRLRWQSLAVKAGKGIFKMG